MFYYYIRYDTRQGSARQSRQGSYEMGENKNEKGGKEGGKRVKEGKDEDGDGDGWG